MSETLRWGKRVRFLLIALGMAFLLAAEVSAQADAVPVPVPATSEPAAPAPAAEPAVAAPMREPDATAKPADAASASQAVATDSTDTADPSGSPSLASRILARIQIHGFVSEGGFVSTANQYIGKSTRGSLKFFEAGLNISATLTDQLRVGVQIVSRSVGNLSEEVPRLDWAIIDYRYRPWLGARAGMIKMPLGLYNEYVGVDAARTSILLPSSMYPLRNRDALLSHTGFALYGDLSLGKVGALEYQAWLGFLAIPRSALDLSSNTSLESVDTKYVVGGQLFYRPPLEGLRIGASYLRTSIDFHIALDAATTQQVIQAGLASADYNGKLLVQQRPNSWWIGSAEYIRGDWLFAFEYGRWLKHQRSSLPALSPTFDEDAERFYGMVTYRVSRYLELGTYYSVIHANVKDRRGHGDAYKKPFHAFQRDLAGSLRIDVNEYWLWKLEGHFVDGTADLQPTTNLNPTRRWGLFLLRTTVTF